MWFSHSCCIIREKHDAAGFMALDFCALVGISFPHTIVPTFGLGQLTPALLLLFRSFLQQMSPFPGRIFHMILMFSSVEAKESGMDLFILWFHMTPISYKPLRQLHDSLSKLEAHTIYPCHSR